MSYPKSGFHTRKTVKKPVGLGKVEFRVYWSELSLCVRSASRPNADNPYHFL